jgi:hypothetical protein
LRALPRAGTDLCTTFATRLESHPRPPCPFISAGM